MHEIKPIIDPLPRKELLRELTPDRKVRDTKRAGNEIYIFTAAECPALMREGNECCRNSRRGRYCVLCKCVRRGTW